MTLNFFNTVSLFSIFITIVLSLFFFITKKGFSSENKILSILLIVFGFQIVYSFMVSNYGYQYFLHWHKLVYLLKQTSFLIGPLIYLYINSFTKKKDLNDYKTLVHFIPFTGVLIFLAFYYRTIDFFIIWLSKIDLFDTIFILAHNLFYIVLSILSLLSIKISFKSFFSSIKASTQNTWLQILLLGFIIIWIVNLNSFAIIMIVRRPSWCAYTGSIFALTVFLFVNTIMFFLLLKPDIYYIIEKYKHNKINDIDKKAYLQKLKDYMEKDKAYLDPDITLESVASALSINSRILSQIINETFKKNFKGYILEYRLKDSMQMLSDSKCSNLTILEILYKVGFNSKSAFNNQFKIYTNLTPQEYRSKFCN